MYTPDVVVGKEERPWPLGAPTSDLPKIEVIGAPGIEYIYIFLYMDAWDWFVYLHGWLKFMVYDFRCIYVNMAWIYPPPSNSPGLLRVFSLRFQAAKKKKLMARKFMEIQQFQP